MLYPAVLLLILWIIKIIEVAFNTSFAGYGLLPQTLSGLKGIVFSPLLHSDWKHLSANSVPFFVLFAGLIYYYGRKAAGILALCWFVTGLWVWIFARGTGIHIGASGVVYALATFHFTSGLLKREPRHMAFALLVVFLYGGLVWGIIPDFYPEKNISWESHLLGGVAGILIAFAYRADGPQRKVYNWDEDEDNEQEFYPDDPFETLPAPEVKPEAPATDEKSVKLNYVYKPGNTEGTKTA